MPQIFMLYGYIENSLMHSNKAVSKLIKQSVNYALIITFTAQDTIYDKMFEGGKLSHFSRFFVNLKSFTVESFLRRFPAL